MRSSHSHQARSASCGDPNLLGAAGLIPVMTLAEQAGLSGLAGEHLRLPADKGANPYRKCFRWSRG